MLTVALAFGPGPEPGSEPGIADAHAGAAIGPASAPTTTGPGAHVGVSRHGARRAIEPQPWGRGAGELSLGVGGAYGAELGVAEVSLGGGYLVTDGLELGLRGSHAALVWRGDRRNLDARGRERLPVYSFDLTPFARFFVLRRRWFSPWVAGGVGPTIYVQPGRATVLGHWEATPGALIGISPRVSLELAVRFSGPIPTSRCEDAAGEADLCQFVWRPRLGVTFSF